MGSILNKIRKLAMLSMAMASLLTIGMLCISTSNTYAEALPFSAGERLTFRLRWALIPAGEAVMEVMPMTTVNGTSAFHFRLTATSNSFVDMFYKVRDRIDAYADASMTHALRYHKIQHEGEHHKNIQVEFNWNDSTAHFFDGKKRQQVDLSPGTFDPLSAFYVTRMHDYETDDRIIFCPVTDGKKAVDGEARIIRKERVVVYNGTYDAYLIEPDLKHVGGVFKKDKDAKIKLWITADEKRLPIKFASKVAVGSFVGELVSIEKIDTLQAGQPTQIIKP